MKKETILQILIVVIGVFALTINFMLFKDWRGLFYYTILSNIYVTGFYFVTLCLKAQNKLVKNDKYYALKGLMLLEILGAMIVYFVAVNEDNSIYSGHNFECYMVHIVMPVLALIECLFCEEKGYLKYKYLIGWSFSLVIYCLILIGYNNIFNGKFLNGKTYPYDVMNFEKLGILRGTINCFAVLIAFIIIGSLIVLIDNKMKANRNVGDNNGQ